VFTLQNLCAPDGFVDNIQFFNLDKGRLQISIIYSSGLQKAGECDFTYSLPSGHYAAKVGTRGSNLTIQLGYPIPLVNFDKTNKK
jgi:hypothetical protein